MPKKLGLNTKAEEAKAKKEEAKKGKEAAEQKQKEDQEWREAGEGAKTKAQAKKDEQVCATAICTPRPPTVAGNVSPLLVEFLTGCQNECLPQWVILIMILVTTGEEATGGSCQKGRGKETC